MTTTEQRIEAARKKYTAKKPHAVLIEVRKIRAKGGGYSPTALYEKAEENGDLYFHAMIEAGFILDGPKGQPYTVCPICDFKFE